MLPPFLTVLLFALSNVSAQEPPRPLRSRDLFGMAEELKERGVYEDWSRLIVSFPHVEDYDKLHDLCDAVVLATLVDSRSRPNVTKSSVETVHRFRIDELVSGSVSVVDRQGVGSGAPRGRADVPGTPGFGPPSTDEVLVIRSGGMLRIEGVTFRHISSYFPFKTGSQYILFLKRIEDHYGGYYGGRSYAMMAPWAGPYGCVEMGPDGSLKSRRPRFQEILDREFGADQEELLRHLRGRKHRPGRRQ